MPALVAVFMEEEMSAFSDALTYADLGWKVVQLWGVSAPGRCTCWQGAKCGTPGKHPVESAWPEYATDDAEKIEAWFESSGDFNIGLLLGPRSELLMLS